MAVFLFLAIAGICLMAGLMMRRYTRGSRVFLLGLTAGVPVAILLSWQIM
jgi:hypothetical protein